MTDVEMAKNELEFKNLLKAVSRSDANIDGLLEQLDNSNWFTSPATTEYHDSEPGGLVKHALNVRNNLIDLCKLYNKDYSDNTITIVSLLHEMSKMNQYEKSVRNKKVYSDSGSKRDELGKFDWVSEECYTSKKFSDRFVIGTSGQTTEYMVSSFIPLKREESVALLNFNTAEDGSTSPSALLTIYKKFPLTLLLHMADMAASFIEND